MSIFFSAQRYITRVALVVFAASALSWGIGFGAQSLAWEKDTIDLTADIGAKTIEKSLRFKNKSSHFVRVVDVHPSCGCISVEMSKDSLAPGEEGEIKVIFKVGSKSGQEKKHIDISSDESGSAAYRVNLVINIPKWIEVEASELIWATSSGAVKKFIRIWSPLNKPFEIVSTSHDSHRLKVDFPTEARNASSYLIGIEPVSTAEGFQESVAFQVRFNQLERDFVFYAQVK